MHLPHADRLFTLRAYGRFARLCRVIFRWQTLVIKVTGVEQRP
jgi:hypothetical protein